MRALTFQSRILARSRFLGQCCLFCLLLFTFAAAFAAAAPTPATVIIGGKVVPFIVAPFVGPDGQVYAPVDAVHLLGADYTTDPQAKTVTITGRNGHPITVLYNFVQDRYCIPLQKVALALGANTDWQPTTRILTLRAKMQMVRQDGNALTIYTSYPVYYRVNKLDQPHRLYVDLYGLDLAAAPVAVPTLAGGNVTRIRSGQINYNTVRIVVDLKKMIPFQIASSLQTDRVTVALGGAEMNPNSPARTLPLLPLPVHPPPVVVNPPPPILPTVSPANGVHITGVSYKVVNDGLTQIAIKTTGQAKYRTETLDNPNRLAFDLAGATLDSGVKQVLTADHPIIKAIRAGILHLGQSSFGRIVIDLSRLVGFTVTNESADGSTTYLINLQTPHTASLGGANSLVGKIVVLDPGHGGQDTGATYHGVYEKNIALAVGKRLRDVLTQNGATVFMTRADDSFPTLYARPNFAIAHNADYYVSIHCDELGLPGSSTSHTGTTVYYHAQNEICRRLAQDILTRVGEVSGLPVISVRSDTVRFQSGFAVLRGSPMPAVLVECGYMNNAQDLEKLLKDDTQQHIAEGIVAGLRDFIADQAAQ